MGADQSSADDGTKLQDLCDRLDVDYDEARYALARGILPRGVDAEPGRGNHRLFNSEQAFHLAVALKLKASGVNTPLAGQIAEWSQMAKWTPISAVWKTQFARFYMKGRVTFRPTFIEVGDADHVRLVFDVNPGRSRLPPTGPWVDMRSGVLAPSFEPAVVIRVDLAHLARLLAVSPQKGRD